MNRGTWRLACVLATFNALEAAAAIVFDPGPSRSLSIQATGLAPFAVFHDLRWLSVYASSWPHFAVEWIGAVVVRGLLIALSVRWTWPSRAADHGPNAATPGDHPIDSAVPTRPPFRELAVRGVAATAVLSILLAPSTALVFAAGVVPVSWLVIAGVPTALLLALVVHPMPIRSGWWRRPIPLRSAMWVLISFLVATAAGAVVAVTSPGWAIVIAALVGVFNARAWRGFVTGLVGQPVPRRPIPVVPIALGVLVVVVSWGAVTGFSHATPRPDPFAGEPATNAAKTGRALLVVSGYGSRWTAARLPIPGGWREVRFSYRGLSRTGNPLPYTSGDTVKPLPVLDRMLAAQVSSVASASGRRVDIVAESEGTLIVESYLHATPSAPVDTVVLTSPLLVAGANTYPPAGRSGSGTVAASVMSLVSDAFRSSAPINLSPYNAFLASIVKESGQLRNLASCPVPNVRQVAIVALADAASRRPDQSTAFPAIVVPHFHAGMLSDPSIDSKVGAILSGASPQADGVWSTTETLISSAASTWQTPATTASNLRPDGSTSSFRQCSTVDRQLAMTMRRGA